MSAAGLFAAGIALAEAPQKNAADAKRETAIFAGGCFWCMEPPFEKVTGVIAAESGYTGGQVKNPAYKQVSDGATGHLEVVRITYDPAVVGYAELLEIFWKNIDPLDAAGQFCDKGGQYASAEFYLAEDYHRDYYKKNTTLYKFYRFNCGRDRRLEEVGKLLQ